MTKAQDEAAAAVAKPLRLFVVRRQYSAVGGGELILQRMIRGLMARGVDVTLLAQSWPEEPDGPRVLRVGAAPVRSLRRRSFVRAACRHIVGDPAALVHSHERIPCCDIYRAGDGVHAANLEARLRGASWLRRAAIRLSPFHRNALALEAELYRSPRLKAVLVNSMIVASDIERWYGFPKERIHLVRNGIDLSRFTVAAREEHRAAMRASLGVDAARPVILLVGTSFRKKGVATAIDVLARSHEDAELWIVGRDRRPEVYRRIAERAGVGGRVRFLGPRPDTLPYYAAADVFFLPSIYDAFPSAAIEALACGLPVVTSTNCGASEAARRLDPALIRDPADTEGFAEALSLAFDMAGRPETAAAARAIAMDYDVDRMIERLLSIYATLAPSR